VSVSVFAFIDLYFQLVSLSDAASAFSSGSSPVHAPAAGDDASEAIDIDDLDFDKLMDVNSAIAVEKEIAADTIGTLFATTQGHFLGFVEQCTLELVALLPHYYEGIRKSATDSLLEIVRSFYELSDHEEWVPGSGAVSWLSWHYVRCTKLFFPSSRRNLWKVVSTDLLITVFLRSWTCMIVKITSEC
jgi:hypothetical protein